jgi:hypothetical protein
MEREKSKVTVYKNLISRCKKKNDQNHRFTSLPGESKRMRRTRQAVNVYRIVTSETPDSYSNESCAERKENKY